MRIESYLNIHSRENHDIVTNNPLQPVLVTLPLGPLSTWSNFHPSPKIIDANRDKYFKFASCLYSLFDAKLVQRPRGKEA